MEIWNQIIRQLDTRSKLHLMATSRKLRELVSQPLHWRSIDTRNLTARSAAHLLGLADRISTLTLVNSHCAYLNLLSSNRNVLSELLMPVYEWDEPWMVVYAFVSRMQHSIVTNPDLFAYRHRFPHLDTRHQRSAHLSAYLVVDTLKKFGANLYRLDLPFRHLEKSAFLGIAQYCTSLTSLDLRCTNIENAELQEVLKQCGPQLKCLRLMNVQLGDMTLIFFRQYLKHLRQLDLFECLQVQTMRKLIMAISSMSQLISVRITGLPQNADALIDHLCTNAAKLEHLQLSGRGYFSDETQYQYPLDITSDAFRKLAVFQLKELRLNGLKFITNDDMLVVLKQLSSLTILDLRCCDLLSYSLLKLLFEGLCPNLEQWILHAMSGITRPATPSAFQSLTFIRLPRLKIVSFQRALPAFMHSEQHENSFGNLHPQLEILIWDSGDTVDV